MTQYRLSQRVTKVAPSATMAVEGRVQEMRRKGEPVIGFGAGEPDFPTPEAIKDAGIEAISSNFTKYTPTGGTAIATPPPERLRPSQSICHIDRLSVEPKHRIVASVLYLFRDARLGGTSFYGPNHPPEVLLPMIGDVLLIRRVSAAFGGKIGGLLPMVGSVLLIRRVSA